MPAINFSHRPIGSITACADAPQAPLSSRQAALMHLQLLDKMVPACETLPRVPPPPTLGLIRVPVICDADSVHLGLLSLSLERAGLIGCDGPRLRRREAVEMVLHRWMGVFRGVITGGGGVGGYMLYVF